MLKKGSECWRRSLARSMLQDSLATLERVGGTEAGRETVLCQAQITLEISF